MINSFAYPGGKWYLLNLLMKFIPSHRRYVEVFGGSAKLLLNKERVEVEVYNDYNYALYCLMLVIKDRLLYSKFMQRNELFLFSRNHFEESIYNIDYYTDLLKRKGENHGYMIELAYYKIVNMMCSFSILGKTYSGSITRNFPITSRTTIDNLYLLHNRLSNVEIFNKSFEDIIPEYNSSDTFIYLDPPYVLHTRLCKNIYKHEMTDEQHANMLDLCLDSRSKILISGYDNELYNSKLKGWNTTTKDSVVFMGNPKKQVTKNIKVEKLWYNYDLDDLFT